MPPDALVVVRSPCWCNYPLLFRRHKQDTAHRRWHQRYFVFVFILTVHPLQPTNLFAPDLEAKPLQRNSRLPLSKPLRSTPEQQQPCGKVSAFSSSFCFFSIVESQTQWNLRRIELGEDEVAGGRVGGGLNYRTKPRRPHLNFLLSPSPLLPTFKMFSCHWRSLFLILHKRSEGVQPNLCRAG